MLGLMNMQGRNLLAVIAAATVVAWVGLRLADAVLPSPAAPSTRKNVNSDHGEAAERLSDEHPEAVIQGGRVKPSNAPIEEHWEDKYFPFLGFEREAKSAARILASGPTAQRVFAADSEILIPAGEAVIGDPRIPGARPSRRVQVPAFYLDRYEVTNQRYGAFVQATGRRAPYVHENWAAIYNWYKERPPENLEGIPVVLVTHTDAAAFCQWNKRRLPTEIEWEYAARGPAGRKYPWGAVWDSTRANVVSRISGPLKRQSDWDKFEAGWTGSKKPEIYAVGGYPADRSPFGVMDMAGNVSEWTAGTYVLYPNASKDERPGLGSQLRVARGNSWGNRDYSSPLANRYPYPETRVDSVIGFRCARSER